MKDDIYLTSCVIILYKIDGDGENFSSSLFYFLTYNVPGIIICLTIRLNVKRKDGMNFWVYKIH
jgi:hypothetical protein